VNPDEFGQKVKSKYPQYANIPNQALTQAVIKKYPQYAQAVQQQPQQPAMQQQGVPPPQPQAGNPGQMPPQQPPMGGQPQAQQPMNPALNPAILQKIYKMFPDLLKSKLDTQLNPPLPPDAYHQALTNQANAEAVKAMRDKPDTWKVAPYLAKDGNIIETDTEGNVREVPISAQPKPTPGSAMADVRDRQFTIQDLPSHQGNSTVAGAASQVRLAARQGMSLIARPGSPQRTASASADLARAITRAAPSDESLTNANFNENLVTRWATMKQKITADPQAVNNPEIRKEIFNIFKEMQDSATPFIADDLKTQRDLGKKIPDSVYDREIGKNMPQINYQESIQPPSVPGSTSGDWSPTNESRLQELLRKKQNGTLGS
jgi:hypothetical protein